MELAQDHVQWRALVLAVYWLTWRLPNLFLPSHHAT